MSDLDRKSFKTNKSLQQCLQDKLHGANPSVLWSGGGYRILQPLDADVDVILEMESIFAKFHEPSRGLMRYAEKLMTYGKADSNHSNNVSFGNCMVRIPGSYNAKYIQFDDNGQIVNIPPKSEVKIGTAINKRRKIEYKSIYPRSSRGKNNRPNPKGWYRQTVEAKDCRRESGNAAYQGPDEREITWTVHKPETG